MLVVPLTLGTDQLRWYHLPVVEEGCNLATWSNYHSINKVTSDPKDRPGTRLPSVPQSRILGRIDRRLALRTALRHHALGGGNCGAGSVGSVVTSVSGSSCPLLRWAAVRRT